MPLAEALPHEGLDAGLLGLLLWPSPDGAVTVVRAHRQDDACEQRGRYAALNLTPCGTPGQYAQRVAVEADAAGEHELAAAAARASVDSGGGAYTVGDLAASGRSLAQYLLLKVGPFADVWEALARSRMGGGEETAALVAAERASALNPGWGCCLRVQSELMAQLGRREERRDLAIAALEAPYWTLGAPLRDVITAAEQAHVSDLKALFRELDERVRAQQNAPPRSARELALMRAIDAMDEVVRTEGRWRDSRPAVAEAMREVGLENAAQLAELT